MNDEDNILLRDYSVNRTYNGEDVVIIGEVFAGLISQTEDKTFYSRVQIKRGTIVIKSIIFEASLDQEDLEKVTNSAADNLEKLLKDDR
jgi:hypothetical protein